MGQAYRLVQTLFSYKHDLHENRVCFITIAPVLIFLAAFIFFPDEGRARIVEEHIYVVPTGNVDKRVIENIKRRLPASLPMSANAAIDQRDEIPESAYNPSRKQYNAQNIVDDISRRITVDTGNERAIIITDLDLYMPDTDFVFGLADAKKGMCVISLARLGNEERAAKEAIHELGHSWGLNHCSKPKCVMYLSNSLQDIDKKRNTFCRECQDKLRNRYVKPLVNVKL